MLTVYLILSITLICLKVIFFANYFEHSRHSFVTKLQANFDLNVMNFPQIG